MQGLSNVDGGGDDLWNELGIHFSEGVFVAADLAIAFLAV